MPRRILLVLFLTLCAWIAFFYLSIDSEPLRDSAQYREAPAIPIVGLKGSSAMAASRKVDKPNRARTELSSARPSRGAIKPRTRLAPKKRVIAKPARRVVKSKLSQQDKEALKPKSRRWIRDLSGEKVDLDISRHDLRPIDCARVECPERGSDVTLFGVVMEPGRIGKSPKPLMDGDVEFGDAARTPAVYIK